MFRIKIAVVVVGGIAAFYGIQELRVSHGASTEAVEVDLATLEAGDALPDSHIRLGPHIALYPMCYYEYRKGKHEHGEPGPGTSLTCTYYPVISNEHSFLQAFQAWNESLESADDQSAIQPPPAIGQFAVLVKSDEFSILGEIPDDFGSVPSVQGLVINTIESLDDEETNLLRQNFPGLDVEQVLILEKDRQPAGLGKSLGAIVGGGVISLAGVAWMLAGRGE